ncbi:MAG: gliding motility-associated C-terminal domain-containing protein, partial [Bacteroidetes bacterium]|nr:gliding motility-associated C-terminal domain-containing protein [Bacteroidota bacterium]
TTVYQVTSNLTGVCANKDTVTISLSNPSVSFTADPLTGFYPLTVNFTNTSSANAINLFWNFGDPASADNTSALINPSHIYEEGGNYIVILIGTDAKGCTDTATTLIVVEKLFVPNVFTPGGYNPKFLVSASGLSEYFIQLFNRWGKKVFESNDINNSWDGKDCVDGTYFYVIKATGVDGKVYDKKGFVQRIESH